MANHPGQILREGFLEPLGIKPAELARALHVQRSTLSRLLAGKQGMTPEMAGRLGIYFQVPPLWWLEMQAAYDAARVESDPFLAQGVEVRPHDADFLLTPTGALHLGRRSPEVTAPIVIPYADFDRSAPMPAPRRYVARPVRYPNGMVALVSEPE